ncbi:unnamed protein product [Lota lota]
MLQPHGLHRPRVKMSDIVHACVSGWLMYGPPRVRCHGDDACMNDETERTQSGLWVVNGRSGIAPGLRSVCTAAQVTTSG